MVLVLRVRFGTQNGGEEPAGLAVHELQEEPGVTFPPIACDTRGSPAGEAEACNVECTAEGVLGKGAVGREVSATADIAARDLELRHPCAENALRRWLDNALDPERHAPRGRAGERGGLRQADAGQRLDADGQGDAAGGGRLADGFEKAALDARLVAGEALRRNVAPRGIRGPAPVRRRRWCWEDGKARAKERDEPRCAEGPRPPCHGAGQPRPTAWGAGEGASSPDVSALDEGDEAPRPKFGAAVSWPASMIERRTARVRVK